MELPTKKTPATTNPQELSILLYGQPKIGKSTFASRMNNALFLATEQGLNSLDVYQVPILDWESFLSACASIASGKHDYKTIVIDTVDVLFKLCNEYVCKKHSIEHGTDLGFGKGFSFINNEFQRAINKLASLPYGLVKTKDFVFGFADMILYCESIQGEEEAEKRVIRTKPSKNLDAGDRTGKLPPVIPLSYPEFEKAMNQAVGQTETKPAEKATKGKSK
jgi:hypothetical protein